MPKISALPPGTTVAPTDAFPFLSRLTNVTERVSFDTLQSAVANAGVVQNLISQQATLGSNSAANVNFLQAGLGAITRKVQSKERDFISVFDFMSSSQIADVLSGGASLDVSAAINLAISAAGSSEVIFPGGPTAAYNVSSTIQVSSDRLVLRGIGNPRITTSSAIPIITLGNGISGARKVFNRITGLQLDGAGVATVGIQTNGVKSFTIDDDRILNIAGPCIDIAFLNAASGDFAGCIENCHLILSQWGIRTHSDNNQLTISGNFIENNSLGGITLDDDATATGSEGIVIIGGRGAIQNNSNVQIKCAGTTALSIIGLYGECGSAAPSEFGNPGPGNATDRILKLGTATRKATQVSIIGGFWSSQAGVQTYPVECVNVGSITLSQTQTASGGTGYTTGILLSTSVDSGLWNGNFYAGTTNTLPSSTTNWIVIRSDGIILPFGVPISSRNGADSGTQDLIRNEGAKGGVFLDPNAIGVRIGGVVTSGNKIFPSTPAPAEQATAGIFAGSGLASNAQGAVGDSYFRGDGGLGSNIYKKFASPNWPLGSWTPII